MGKRQGPQSRLLWLIFLLAALPACSSEQSGQLLYNTGKAYCDHQPKKCGGRPDDLPHASPP